MPAPGNKFESRKVKTKSKNSKRNTETISSRGIKEAHRRLHRHGLKSAARAKDESLATHSGPYYTYKGGGSKNLSAAGPATVHKGGSRRRVWPLRVKWSPHTTPEIDVAYLHEYTHCLP